MVKIVPIILGVVGSVVVALIISAINPSAGIFDPAKLAAFKEADLLGWPIHMENTIFAIFKDCDTALLISSVIAIMPLAIATMMEHIGDISAIGSTVGKNYIEEPGLHRSLIGDGIATTLASIFGGPANTTYGENTGVLALTKVYDPRVIRIAAVLAILFSFSPKFAALVSAMPAATIGGVSLILYGMISSVGVRNIVENRVDFTKNRNVIIAALIMGLTLGIHFSGALGADTVNSVNGALKFVIGDVTISLSGLAVGAIVGIVLNAILPGNDYKFGEDHQGDTSVNFKV